MKNDRPTHSSRNRVWFLTDRLTRTQERRRLGRTLGRRLVGIALACDCEVWWSRSSVMVRLANTSSERSEGGDARSLARQWRRGLRVPWSFRHIERARSAAWTPGSTFATNH